ncbi:hypothetical protein CHR28_19780 [Streptomyces sp. XY006]|nr:hypothetical protein CHR28_19780 [Streptomyces sp. XY006]
MRGSVLGVAAEVGALRSPAVRGASPKLFEQGVPPAPTRAAPGGTSQAVQALGEARLPAAW